jgi:DNA modification methylase
MDDWLHDIHQGDAAETLAQMPDSSVHMVMTSPPYFGLRDYGADGQIGLEDSLDEYISELVAVFDELRRVLRDDGSVWLNLGDSYGGDSIVRSDADWTRPSDDGYEEKHTAELGSRDRRQPAKLGRKNKLLVPHRVAIALQECGWLVRSDAPWIKDMPDPASDRFRRGPENVFHLTAETDYWANSDALNRRGWFDCSPARFQDAHFATFPEELPKGPIKGTCPSKVCAKCGQPYDRIESDIPAWEREISKIDRPQLKKAVRIARDSDLTVEHLKACRSVGFSDAGAGQSCQDGAGRNSKPVESLAREAKEVLGGYFREFTLSQHQKVSIKQACNCDTDATEPGIVLDPFAGAGTTCLVAKQLGRRFVGIDLNPEYVAMAQQRVGVTVDEPERLLEDGEKPLRAFTDGGSS